MTWRDFCGPASNDVFELMCSTAKRKTMRKIIKDWTLPENLPEGQFWKTGREVRQAPLVRKAEHRMQCLLCSLPRTFKDEGEPPGLSGTRIQITSLSPVRMLYPCSTGSTKIRPSPISPVLAVSMT